MKTTHYGYLRNGLTLAMLLAITACTVGPDFKAPAVPSPERWTDWHSGPPSSSVPGKAPATTSQTADGNWWQVFGDPVLDQLQAQVREGSPDLHTALLRFAQVRLQRQIVASLETPEVSFSAAASRNRQSRYAPNNRMLEALGSDSDALEKVLTDPYSLYQAGFDVSWELDLWGRVSRLGEAAQAEVDGAAATLDDVLLSVSSELARNYFEVRTAQRQTRLLEQEAQILAAHLQVIAVRAREGEEDGFAVERQEARLASLHAQIPAWKALHTQAGNRIALLLGEHPGALETLLAERPDNALSRPLPNLQLGLPGDLARERPDIRAAQARLHRATAGIGVAEAELYPSVMLGADFGFESYKSGQFADWSSRTWSVGPRLDLPLFDRGRRSKTVVLRTLEQQEAAVAFHRTVLAAWQEVDDAMSRYHNEYQRAAHLKDSYDSKARTYEWTRVRYAAGEASYLEELEAQRTVLEAQRDLVNSDSQLRTHLISIYKSMGGHST
ncbi:multidrug efflux MFS outer membrane protein, PltO [Pseudomonas protegens Cab57]|uniref:efflux transporter outer membrane subunit n=1 Tax=Pseudomonas protegens TaxID=380021 RepID=UPI00044257EC|nr:efflux transporter outer membrane subunit [Pseudomonas protegens]BAO62191.1 multidrug efflux MFS outer membrane protein, PltO [Pseudomonas protegens Cab57]